MNLTANRKNISGFTLIELLVVISIIGILAAMVTVSFTSSQKQARDAKRKSDLKFYQSALELDANKFDGSYMACSGSSCVASTTLCNSLALSSCPEDPKNSVDPVNNVYRYQSDGVSGTHTATTYALWTKLENVTGYMVICSSGSVISTTSQPSLSTCQ